MIKNNKKKILVTGGAGYIGSKLCSDLVLQNFDVYSLDKKINKNFSSKKIVKVILDLRYQKKLEHLFSKIKFDYVIHLAAKKNVLESEIFKKKILFK